MQAPAASRTGPLEPWLWFLLAFGVYAACGATVFYKTDGPDILWLLHEGLPHPWHVGYLPLLKAWRWVIHLVGIEPSLMRLGTSFSALGAAVGVAGFAAGLRRLGLDAPRARAAVLLLAAAPTALLFATCVEFHALLLGATGVAFWWTTVMIARPSWWGMALLGALTHVAFLMHFSGICLPAFLLSFFVARRWADSAARGRTLALGAVAGVVHVVLWYALPRLFVAFYGVHSDLAAAFAKEASIGRPQSLDWTPVIFAQEWLWPVLPLSVTCWLGATRRGLRLEFAAFVLGFLPFLYLCVRQLVFEPENGAYLLPLVPAAALLTVQALPLRVAASLALVAVLGAPFVVRCEQTGWDDPAEYARVIAGYDGAAAGRPYVVLLGTHREMSIGYARLAPWTGAAPRRDFLYVRQMATMPRTLYTEAMRRGSVEGLRRVIDAGGAVLTTAATRAFLRDPESVMRAEKLLADIPRNDEMTGPLLSADLERA
ncbi:MAG TPA: hypothetical protein VFA35_11710, partial [Burkholderiaceae bacterium]|nr:hypothetical protein [Burkholderiaceae bacterium]